MTTTPKPKPPEPRVTLVEDGEALRVEYRWKLYRFLLDDGRTVDVAAISDDSDVRGAVLTHTKAERIEGVARIEEL